MRIKMTSRKTKRAREKVVGKKTGKGEEESEEIK